MIVSRCRMEFYVRGDVADCTMESFVYYVCLVLIFILCQNFTQNFTIRWQIFTKIQSRIPTEIYFCIFKFFVAA